MSQVYRMEKWWPKKSKTPIVIIAVIVSLFLIFQTYVVMSTNNSESQKYKVLLTEKDFEIRFYPSVTMATIKSSAKTHKELSSSGFRKLANYIFGGNKEQVKIAMTSPVHMDVSDSQSSMSFVMPADFTKDSSPLPIDSEVEINTAPSQYVAALEFEGFASDKEMVFYTEKLKRALQEREISYYGHFRLLGYNPPYQLIDRKNEVIVNVIWNSK